MRTPTRKKPARSCTCFPAIVTQDPPSTPLALVRLLQLASPALPVGAFSYSQGLEWQVDCGAIRTEADAGDWILAVLDAGMARFELPLLAALMRAWATDDGVTLTALNDDYLASREAAELRAETVQMGYSCVTAAQGARRLPARGRRAGGRLRSRPSRPPGPAPRWRSACRWNRR
jgi:urease accessory protein UreF